MGQEEAFSEAVFIFDGGEITEEMQFADFEACLAGDAKLEAYAASVVSGMYVVIGTGLAIRGVVCFTLGIDENGDTDSSFSVPLQHLASVAGGGPDLGSGPIRLACRSQCPVSWHAHNLWEPEGDGDANPLAQAQSVVRSNRLGYDQQTVRNQESSLEFDVLDETGDTLFDGLLEGIEVLGGAEDAGANGEASPLADEAPPSDEIPPANEIPPADEILPTNETPPANEVAQTNGTSAAKEAPPTDRASTDNGSAPPNGTSIAKGTPPANRTSTDNGMPPDSRTSADNGAPNAKDDDPFARHSRNMLQRKIERTFGDEGTVSLQKLIVQHAEQTDALTAKHRGDLEQQQQVYLDQISGCRDEIQKLKSELRHEQARSQRLQQLLRGELP